MSRNQGGDEGSAGREKILAAGLAAQAKQYAKRGGDVYEMLESCPASAHADVVEILNRQGVLR